MLKKFLIVFVFVLIFFGIRAPFYSHPVIGEEGIFTNLFYSQPKGPNYALIAKVKGTEILVPDNHPAMLYEMLSATGRISEIFSSDARMAEEARILRVRIAFSGFQLCIWLLLLFMLFRKAQPPVSPFQIMLIFTASVSPLGIASSIMTRIEGSVGVLMCGLVLLAVAAAARAEKIRSVHCGLFAASAFLFGMGRNEWTILFIVTAVIVFAYSFIDKESEKSRFWIFLAAGLIGCLLGNLASYLLDPGNYAGGFGLIFFRSEAVQMLEMGVAGDRRRLLVRLFMSFTTLSFLIISVGLFFKRRSGVTLLLIALPGALFFGYLPSFLSGTFYSYRYFAPAMVCTAIAAASLIGKNHARWTKAVILLVCLAIIGQTIYFSKIALSNNLSVTDGFGLPVKAYFPDRETIVRNAQEAGCVPVLPNWTKYSHPEADFVIPSLGRENGKRVVEKNGGNLCP